MNSIQSLFNPRSVAIIGASSDSTKISGRPVRYLIESGFKGGIYPINASRSEVQGLRAYPTLEAVGESIDCAILATASDDVVPSIRACVRHGVKSVVIFSAGFAEVGPEGERRQAEIARIARESGIRVLGPNCLGAFNVHSGTFLTFSGVFEDVVGTRGRLGLISQSGGYAGETLKLALRRGLQFGTWITTGNEVDIEFGEILEYMAESDDVDVILGYIEGIRSRDSFIRGLEKARERRKPVILLKVGRTKVGAQAAASHTAALSGADDVYDAVFRQYGAWRARTTEEMLDIAYAALRRRFPSNNRVAILTNSGGIGVQAADFADDEGLDVAPLPPPVQAKILRRAPNAGALNPIDVTGQAASDRSLMADTLSAVLDTGGYGSAYVCVGLLGGLPYIAGSLVDAFSQCMSSHADALVAVLVTAPPEVVSAYEAAGMLVYDEPSRALRAIAAMHAFHNAWETPPAPGEAASASQGLLPPAASLSEVQAKLVLAGAGVPGPMEFLASGPVEAAAQAAAIRRPVAIKVVSPDILHKTDVGGVALNVAPDKVHAEVERMRAGVAAAAPSARIDGFLITPMLAGGVECIVGAQKDPLFGPVVLFGLGGVTVEIYRDVAVRLAPVDEAAARQMVKSIAGYRLLDGYRGRPPADVEALIQAIVAVSNLAAANADRLKTIEINPLVVMPSGQGVVALDAVIETADISAG